MKRVYDDYKFSTILVVIEYFFGTIFKWSKYLVGLQYYREKISSLYVPLQYTREGILVMTMWISSGGDIEIRTGDSEG